MGLQTNLIRFGLTAAAAACWRAATRPTDEPRSAPHCDGIPLFPADEPSSDAYRGLVNAVLKEQETGLEWKEDRGYPNIPDSFQDVSVQNFRKYAAQDSRGAQLNWVSADAALCKARQTVEKRRLEMVHAARAQMNIIDTPTTQRLPLANAAERAWLEAASVPLAQVADNIFATQTSLRNGKIDLWMSSNADPDSWWHYSRIRTADLPNLLPKFVPQGFPEAEKYGGSIPWYPKMPSYNAMWPEDLSKEELEYIGKNFKTNDPIRLPYTVVERVSDADRKALAKGPAKSPEGLEIQWLTQGLGGQWYKVTNVVFHPRFRPFFLQAAAILEKNADIQGADQSRLTPSFRDYTLTMARCFRNGDLMTLLKADLNQQDGNLFLTFFPHEGYWDDQNKFAWMFEAGVRDHETIDSMSRYGYVFQAFNDEGREIARTVGAPAPDIHVDTGSMKRLIQSVWTYRLGGFLRAFPGGAVAGHDYPKWGYDGITDHRVVVLADTVYGGFPFFRGLAEELFPKAYVDKITPGTGIRWTLWHEGSHGSLGNKPDTITTGGKTFGEAYGPLWGAVSEPQADLAFVTANRVMLEHGDMTPEEAAALQAFTIVRGARALRPKAAVTEKFMMGAPHLIGSITNFARAVRDGGVQLPAGSRTFVVDEARTDASLGQLRREMITFGFQDRRADYAAYIQDHVQSIPDPILARALEAQKAKAVRWMINHGDLRPLEK